MPRAGRGDRISRSRGEGGLIGALCSALALFWLLSAPALAKPPTLDGFFPPGARRGGSVEVTASGKFDHWPVRAWASSPGLKIEVGGENGKLKITPGDDLAPGVYSVRLFDDDGASPPRPFFVGTIPEVVEVEPNDGAEAVQKIDQAAVTINGKLGKPGDVDAFSVHLARGQTLVASMEANRRLRSPMDAVLQVVGPGGFVLTENDDDHGSDPQVIFKSRSDGAYMVRAFAFPATADSSIRFAGGPAFVYRLTITTEGFLDHVFPLAVGPNGPARVEASGWNIPDDARRLAVKPIDGDDLAIVSHPLLANSADVRVVPHTVAVEAEPNDASHPQSIPLPSAVSGRIDPPRDVDAYRFGAKKGDVLLLNVASRTLGQPLDVVLRLVDATGKILSEADDSPRGRDAELRATAPADGDYTVLVRDLNGQGGPRYAYLLTVSKPIPDFALTLKADQFTLTPGKTLELPVAVERTNGFDGAIEVGLAEPIEGLKAEPVKSEPKDGSSKSVTLKLTATAGASSRALLIVGKSGGDRRRNASIVWLHVAKALEPSK